MYIVKTFTVKLNDGSNKQIKVYGKTEEEAKEKLQRKKWEYENGLLVFNSNTLFRKWAYEWLDTYKKPKIRQKHYNDTKRIIDKVFMPSIGGLKMADIKIVHLQNAINELEGFSNSYINKAVMTIKSIMDKALINDIITKNPALKIEAPSGTRNYRRALTEEEQKYFIDTIPIHPHGALFGISLACGLRPAEARALTVSNVDRKAKKITVTQAVEADTVNIKPPKTEAGKRVIPVPDWYMDMLIPLLNKNSIFLFPNNSGGLITKQNYMRAWKSFLRMMDIAAGAKLYRNKIILHSEMVGQDLTPYYLRHSYATKLAELGVDIKTAQYLLGHTDIKMTANIYTHVNDNMLNEAKKKLRNWTS